MEFIQWFLTGWTIANYTLAFFVFIVWAIKELKK
jgi:hypothetical protein